MRQRILLIIGSGVLLLAVYTFFLRPRPSARVMTADVRAVGEQLRDAAAAKAPRGAGRRTTTPTPAPQPSAARADSAKTVLAPPESWGSDPFVRDWIMVNELANLSLKAVTLGGDRAYALINDQILEEGDQISGKRIVRIESDKVTLEQGGRTFTLLLGE